jgi:hypothetical protein
MARNNLAVVGRQHRIDEAEALDRRAICLIRALLWRRALLGVGFSESIGTSSIAWLN